MEELCPRHEKCPIFTGVLSGRTMTAKAYTIQFCKAGKENWQRCKRYLSKEKYGECPPDLLPNSFLSIEEIGKRYNLNKN